MYKKPVNNPCFVVKEPALLMEFLMKQMAGVSRTKAKGLLSNRAVLVDGRPVTQFDHPLHPGQTVVVNKGARHSALEKLPAGLEVVYEDGHLLVVNKPVGFLSMGKPGPTNVQALLNRYFKEDGQRCTAHLVHRLDRETSGLMIFAKTVAVQQALVNGWRDYVADRRYVALVDGTLQPAKGTVTSYLREDSRFLVHSSDTEQEGGRHAITHYRTLRAGQERSLVELHLETGRKHQIRVHLQLLGHPVVGDLKYGDGSNPIGRLALHAYLLAFRHPVTGQPMSFDTPVPRLFEKNCR